MFQVWICDSGLPCVLGRLYSCESVSGLLLAENKYFGGVTVKRPIGWADHKSAIKSWSSPCAAPTSGRSQLPKQSPKAFLLKMTVVGQRKRKGLAPHGLH
jgi:hypothetical protein